MAVYPCIKGGNMTEKKTTKKGKKFEAEIGSELKETKEQTAIKVKKKYTVEQLVKAIEDVSVEINNAYFRTPYNRCPDCNKGDNTVMAHFGFGGANKLGNLRSFNATIGDVIAWSADTYKGISIIKAKNNGVYELETAPFTVARKEPAVIEKMVVPSKFRLVIGEMAEFLANPDMYVEVELVKIGNGEYPNVIKTKL